MTTTTPHPPTTLHESIPLTPSSAESFLSAFLTDAGRKPNQNEIVMTNLLRVQQALAGVYVPPPPPTATAAAIAVVDAERGEILTEGEARTGEIVREGAGQGGYGETGMGSEKEGVDGEKEGVEVVVVPKVAAVQAAEAGGVDREKRRAEKARRREKVRMKEERKAKKRAKEKGKKGDVSE